MALSRKEKFEKIASLALEFDRQDLTQLIDKLAVIRKSDILITRCGICAKAGTFKRQQVAKDWKKCRECKQAFCPECPQTGYFICSGCNHTWCLKDCKDIACRPDKCNYENCKTDLWTKLK